MADADAWFAPPDAAGVGTVYRDGSVEAFIDAEAYFADLRREVEALADGWIAWIGFEAAGATPMPAAAPPAGPKPWPERQRLDNDTTWFALLEAATRQRGVSLRALLNLHPKPDTHPGLPKYRQSNADLVQALNALPRSLAINDARYLFMNGTHHQKLVLLYGASGLIAYVGTCDLETSRIKNRWCELQCKLRGEAARALYTLFQQRWAEHTAVLQRAGSHLAYLPAPADLRCPASGGGRFRVQVATTYGNPMRPNPFHPWATPAPFFQVLNRPHRLDLPTGSAMGGLQLVPGLDRIPTVVGNDFFTGKDAAALPQLADAARQRPLYAFAPTGHHGIHSAIAAAIRRCRRTIYLEDQYLVDDLPMGNLPAIAALLAAKVAEPGFRKLVVLTTRIDDINDEFQRSGWAHRRAVIAALQAAGPDKVAICQYRSRGDLGMRFGQPHQGAYYIHSKTWVFDDELLITGSANCNRRGYSHDSELDVVVHDADGRAVRDWRIALWLSRLNTQGMARPQPLTAADLADFERGARYWEQPKAHGLLLECHRETPPGPIALPDFNLDQQLQRAAKLVGPLGPIAAMALTRHGLRALWDWVVDPDGS